MKNSPEPPGQRWQLLAVLPLIWIYTPSISAVDFIFNGFSSSDLSLYGNATIDSRVVSLTHHDTFSIGRALYPTRVRTKLPNSSHVLPFSTSFIFAMAPYKETLPGHGLVLLFTPATGIKGASSAQHLGLFNLTNNGNPNNHVLGIEFDVFANQEFNDINDNHVGVDLNSLTSINASDAGYYAEDGSFTQLKLNNGENYQVWVDYSNAAMNVTIAPAGRTRPSTPLLNLKINLSDVFLEQMYVGFTAATGRLVQSHKILGWSFSNSNFSLSDSLITANLPSFTPPNHSFPISKRLMAGIAAGVVLLMILSVLSVTFLIRRKRRLKMMREETEDWELEYWPHRIRYSEIYAATGGFSEKNIVGVGGNGFVYKGVLQSGDRVAIKRIARDNSEGSREFVAEVSSLGRLKHRNLVPLRGWCKTERAGFMLVYDFMENGSLDKRIYSCGEDDYKLLNWDERIRVLRDVAAGVLYLHEGWEHRVLHRDIKASNVLLDRGMNARLGDFGLARVHGHDRVASTTRVVGTVGYLAPELVRTGRASAKTDVFGYGMLVLEVMCGRRPVEPGEPLLVDRVSERMAKGELRLALDRRLEIDDELQEAVDRVLHLGLICAHPDPEARPTMRQVVKLLDRSERAEESESEDMEVYLLEAAKSKNLQSWGRGLRMHPTFADIRESLSSSMSFSWSDVALEGR